VPGAKVEIKNEKAKPEENNKGKKPEAKAETKSETKK